MPHLGAKNLNYFQQYLGNGQGKKINCHPFTASGETMHVKQPVDWA